MMKELFSRSDFVTPVVESLVCNLKGFSKLKKYNSEKGFDFGIYPDVLPVSFICQNRLKMQHTPMRQLLTDAILCWDLVPAKGL